MSRAEDIGTEKILLLVACQAVSDKLPDVRLVERKMFGDICAPPDECTHELLPKEWIQDAIFDELDFVTKEVWEGVDISEARADPQGKILNGRWAASNKGDV